MYEFTKWCFLCASENNVTTMINSLPKELQNRISEFSILNHNVRHMPSAICTKCHKFLQDLERNTKRYCKVEKFFIQLMQSKNRNECAKKLKEEFNLTEDPCDSPQLSIIDVNTAEYNEDDDDVSDSNVTFEFIESEKIGKLSPVAKESVIVYEKREEKKPKLLNPTIIPKIESKLRMNILKCDLCNHSTSTKLSLQNHMQVHIQKGVLFECQTCHKSFAKKAILRNHEFIHKSSIERKLYKCGICEKILSSQASLNSHYNWFHNEKEYPCDVCKTKKFATKGALTEHLKIHSNVKQHKCPICNKEYKTASTLTNHLDTHSNTEYKCSICNLKLNTKRTLRQHEKVHSNYQQHNCNICNAKFKRTKTFKEHLISHTKKRFYECEYCQKTFTNGSNLRKHLKETHVKELEAAEQTSEQSMKKTVKLPKLEDLLMMAEDMSCE